ncbi:undecaprenyl diphosphate synthase [Dysgonomonas alginatilytica]|uniref:Isoprenyl transferase n=1 Tax=Dysgonomonas alginatilytica TaxID=1605892 RepID=A0A2V3PLV8_9BACT|nr:isoprenyl transferase [Dysgonomonas alginatilytica]PXV62818.1 undecaprenyl diphosphate synthase [Dysgonomonas alginatilytica]
MSLLEKINKDRLPQHVAIIMDGNGRWAKQRNLDRTFGHKEGAVSVRSVIETAARLGISYITLYTFSTENWNRPAEEVEALMSLLIESVSRETPELIKNNIRLKAIGDLDRLPAKTRTALDNCIKETSVSTGLTLVLALSYSARWEITEATRKIAAAINSGELTHVDESTISDFLTTKGIPDPDLLIRTGGELRISNFLLWQAAYSEFHFTETLWPDFREEALYEAVVDYQCRERRFGKTSEQINS